MLDVVLADLLARPWLYLSIPLTCGFIGYFTNIVAMKMMFYPVDFIGWKPWLGWQGVIPRKAGKMASIACDTIVPRLISEKEMFERLDPARVADELQQPVTELVGRIADEVMREYEPTLWQSLPAAVREKIVQRVQRDAPAVVADLMDRLRSDVSEVFDLKEMVITLLLRDKQLMNRVFLDIGRPEFRFVVNSGFWMGCLFGIPQALGWLFFQAPWQLPVFGFVVGYLTNTAALQMVFRPQRPWTFGPLQIQGLFFRRQQAVSQSYARLVAEELMTPANIIEGVLRGPYADRVFDMVGEHVRRVIDEQVGTMRPLVLWTVGTRRYAEMKDMAVSRLVAQLPETALHIDRYAREALDIQQTLASRLAALPPRQFEAMLRPAFKEDEWLLSLVGGVLGALVGMVQMLSFALR